MKRILLILALLAVTAAGATASERALFFRFRGIGVGEELIDAVSHLLQGSLEGEGVYTLVRADELVGYTGCFDALCAAEIAREEGFEWAITGSVTRLGSKIIVRVELVDAGEGAVRFGTDGSALTEDDLDTVLKRLARSLSTGKEMEETAEVGMITAAEYEGRGGGNPTRRRASMWVSSGRRTARGPAWKD